MNNRLFVGRPASPSERAALTFHHRARLSSLRTAWKDQTTEVRARMFRMTSILLLIVFSLINIPVVSADPPPSWADPIRGFSIYHLSGQPEKTTDPDRSCESDVEMRNIVAEQQGDEARWTYTGSHYHHSPSDSWRCSVLITSPDGSGDAWLYGSPPYHGCPAGYRRNYFSSDEYPDWWCVRDDRLLPTKPPICPNPIVANPVEIAARNKKLVVTDIEPLDGLGFTRTYRSKLRVDLSSTETFIGANWSADHLTQLTFARDDPADPSTSVAIFLTRADGTNLTFKKDESSGAWVSEQDLLCYTLTETGTAGTTMYHLQLPNGDTELYNAKGSLTELKRQDGSKLQYTYDGRTRLQEVKDDRGRYLRFTFEGFRLSSVTDAADHQVNYAYQDGTLAQAQNGSHIENYFYSSSLDHNLVRIEDGDSNIVSSYTYTAEGLPLTSQLAGGVNAYSFDYTHPARVVVAEASGATTTYDIQSAMKRIVVNSAATTCTGCTTPTESYAYDAHLNIIEKQSGNAKTCYAYDALGKNQIRRVEGASSTFSCSSLSGGTFERRVETDWHATFRVPIERRTYNSANTLVAKTTWTYNTRGQALTQTRTDPILALSRTTTTAYCEQADITAGLCPLLGLVRSINGPRTDLSDITSYNYRMTDEATCAAAPTTCPYRRGDLWKVTNALTQITETLKYDGAGRPLSVKDPNGVITDLEYHVRGWLAASKRRGTNAGTEVDDQITRMEYWPTGLVKKVTQPDGAFTSYTYDAAHRLTDITDNAGNTIHYVLDNAGNRTGENTKDNTGALKRTLSRIYNQLGQLQAQTDAYAHPTGFTYDANGNADTVTDALTRITDSDYDPLNRLSRTLQDVGGIAAETGFQYDAQDNLTKVTDPKGLETNYGYNGLGDLLQLGSPDTGLTAYTYDSGGNRKTQTDARNKTATYSYDALDRLTGVTYPTTSLNVAYTYDTNQAVCITGETFSKGRLTKITDASGTTQYCYDRFGQLVRKHQVTNGVALTVRYAYNAAGRLLSLTYPDGQTAIYNRDGQGRTTGVSVAMAGGECQQVLVSGVQYAPFGPATGWMFGDGSGGSGSMGMEGGSPQGAGESLCVYPPTVSRAFARTLNLNYQPAAIADTWTGGLSLGYEFDPVGNLAKLRTAQQTDPPLATYSYDALNRLTDTKDGPTGTVIEHYAYDATGNRLSLTHPAGVTTPYTYPATSHHLDSVGATARSYDAAGNTTQIGGTARQFVYDDTGRMSQVKAGSTVTMQYAYNGKGEQVRKYLGTANTYTVYDEAGHWLGDYSNTGVPIQQAVWMDDLPVGLMASNGLNYVEADALGTPRVVIDPARDVAVWKWNLTGEAFGNTAPNQNPDGDANTFVFNMRFPGQRYDAASGLNYNYFRDYDAATGRYVQSDPIGQSSGLLHDLFLGKTNSEVLLSSIGTMGLSGTYTYAMAAPLSKFDALGLFDTPKDGGPGPTPMPGGCPLIADITLAVMPNPILGLPPLALKFCQYSCASPGSCPSPDSVFTKYFVVWNPPYKCPGKASR